MRLGDALAGQRAYVGHGRAFGGGPLLWQQFGQLAPAQWRLKRGVVVARWQLEGLHFAAQVQALLVHRLQPEQAVVGLARAWRVLLDQPL
ncbi:hypothetical protein D3C80_1468630 [compost metagenome]